MKPILALLIAAFVNIGLFAQKIETLAQEEVEIRTKHAMPLYLDLPAEMDVRKGYKEINMGVGYTSFKDYNYYRTLVEYAFAPIKRLGIELELPFSFYRNKNETLGEAPENRLDGLRLGTMYSFLVMPKYKTTFSAGFFNEFETTPFKDFGHPIIEGNVLQPYIAGAKVWGDRFHTIIYTGPSFGTEYVHHHTQTEWKFNTTLNYKIGKNESYAGVEVNQTTVSGGNFETIMRPQVHIFLSQQWALGLVATIPISIDGMNAGGFARLIYMP